MPDSDGEADGDLGWSQPDEQGDTGASEYCRRTKQEFKLSLGPISW